MHINPPPFPEQAGRLTVPLENGQTYFDGVMRLTTGEA